MSKECWEYSVDEYIPGENIEEWLNERGQKGWELICIFPSRQFVFKRKTHEKEFIKLGPVKDEEEGQ